MLLALLLTVACLQDPPAAEVKPPTPAESAAALTEALKGKDMAVAQGAVKQHGRVADAAVVKALADGLKHTDPQVRLATLVALRFNADPAATEVLLKQKGNKKISEDVNCAEAFAYALGQKRDKRALPLLKDGLVATGDTNGKVMSAKLYALGRIRDEASCEILMDFMGSAVLKVEQYMVEIRISMAVLTGTDAGPAQRDWRTWWNDNKSKLKILDEEPPLPDAAQRKWTMMWMSEEEIAAERAARKAASGGSGKGDS